MRNLRRLFATAALALMLAVYTFAGEISAPGVMPEPTPTPTPGQVDTPPSVTGEISAPGVGSLDPLTEMTLSLISTLSVF